MVLKELSMHYVTKLNKPYLILDTKIDSKWILDLKTQRKTMKLKEHRRSSVQPYCGQRTQKKSHGMGENIKNF